MNLIGSSLYFVRLFPIIRLLTSFASHLSFSVFILLHHSTRRVFFPCDDGCYKIQLCLCVCAVEVCLTIKIAFQQSRKLIDQHSLNVCVCVHIYVDFSSNLLPLCFPLILFFPDLLHSIHSGKKLWSFCTHRNEIDVFLYQTFDIIDFAWEKKNCIEFRRKWIFMQKDKKWREKKHY